MPEISRPTSRTMSLADLQPAGYNPRADLQPGDPDYENIKTSIETYGLIDDLVFNEQTGNLVGGHQRLKVLQQMGVESVEVKVVDLSPGMERSLNLMLNKAVGRWDDEKLVALVDELGEMEDAGPTGWADDELAPIRSRTKIPNEAEWSEAVDAVQGNGNNLRQMTFILSEEQGSAVMEGIRVAKADGPFVETGNENSNGNALARIAEAYVGKC